MPTAYMFVNCTLGSEEKIIAEFSKVPDIKYGVHDVFVKDKIRLHRSNESYYQEQDKKNTRYNLYGDFARYR